MDHRALDRAGVALRPRAALAIGAAFLLVAAIAAPVAASANGAVVVSGVQGAYGTCSDNGDAGYLMSGDLEGCWVVETFDPKSQFDGKDHFMAKGHERFVGTVLGVPGTFHTDYTYTATYEGDWANFLEIHGRCHHPITSGEGGLAGITGELSFTDVVDVPEYPYWGPIRLSGLTPTVSASTSIATTSGSSNGVTC